MTQRRKKIVPILLAAGNSSFLPFAPALAPFGKKTAIAIALQNCAGLARPIVVLGAQGENVKRTLPRNARVVWNREWRSGLIKSLRAALKQVPRSAAFLVYPVDMPLITREIVRGIVRRYLQETAQGCIVVPSRGERIGHPVIFPPELRNEVEHARTAREVVYRDSKRVCIFRVQTCAIWTDFHTVREYRECLRRYFRARRTSRFKEEPESGSQIRPVE